MAYFTFLIGVWIESIGINPNGASFCLLSSEGTYPLPFEMCNSMLSFAEGSMVQISNSGFITWKVPVTSSIMPAVKSDFPLMEIVSFSVCTSWSRIFLNLICLRFKIISVTSSTTPFSVANSWSAPSITIPVMAYPSSEFNRTLRSALPMVTPYPGSSGRNSNCASKSVAFWRTILSGCWKFKMAIFKLLLLVNSQLSWENG